ncbi:hypothetical protein VTO73DRAFT_1137 [Trametes versicolor]
MNAPLSLVNGQDTGIMTQIVLKLWRVPPGRQSHPLLHDTSPHPDETLILTRATIILSKALHTFRGLRRPGVRR